MAFSNNMTDLLKRIAIRLEIQFIMNYFPDNIKQDKWVTDAIELLTLPEFSRKFPNEVDYPISRAHAQKDGWYLIDEDFIEGLTIIGIRDIDWRSFTNDTLYYTQETGLGSLDLVSMQSLFNMEDIADVQMRKDIGSLFNNGIYLDFKAPNMFKLSTATNARLGMSLQKFNVKLLTVHPSTLLTISPTMMTAFENLAISDTAGFLYGTLKYLDGIPTPFGTVELKLDRIIEEMNKRDQYIEVLENASVSAANDSAPIMLTI